MQTYVKLKIKIQKIDFSGFRKLRKMNSKTPNEFSQIEIEQI